MIPKILVHTIGDYSLDISVPGNVQGDALIARAWRKYISRRSDLLLTSDPNDADFIIYFNFFADIIPNTKAKKIAYIQNVMPPHAWPGGTVGQFNQHKHKFDHFIYTSEKLKQNCGIDGGVVPFGVDMELFDYKTLCIQDKYIHPICFVGNGIRSKEENAKYILPVIDQIAIYGNRDGWGPEYQKACKGKLPIEDEPSLYKSALSCLNVHLGEHIYHDTVNFRIYCILACVGVVISDKTPTLCEKYADFMWLVDSGTEIPEVLDRIRNDRVSAAIKATDGYIYVREHDTFAHRIEALAAFIKGL